MKKFSVISLALMVGVLLVVNPATAYFPEDQFVEGMIFTDAKNRRTVVQNSLVNFSLIVKNLTNDTASNLTIVQDVPTSVKLVSVSDHPFSGDPVFKNDTTITDIVSDKQNQVSYLNMTETEFSLNIDVTIQPANRFGLEFTTNMTDDGSVEFVQPIVTYYDHWGDQYQGRDNSDLQLSFAVQPLPPSTTVFIPRSPTIEPNYTMLAGIFLGLFVVVILGRVLYLKPPIEV